MKKYFTTLLGVLVGIGIVSGAVYATSQAIDSIVLGGDATMDDAAFGEVVLTRDGVLRQASDATGAEGEVALAVEFDQVNVSTNAGRLNFDATNNQLLFGHDVGAGLKLTSSGSVFINSGDNLLYFDDNDTFDPVPDELGPGIRMLSLTGSVYIDADDNTTNIGGEDGLVLISPNEVVGVSENVVSLAIQTPEPEGEGETEYTTDTLFLLSQAEAEPEGEGESETPLSVFLMSTVGNMLFARLDSSQELLAGMELTEDMTARLGNGTGATIACEPNGDVVVTLGSSSMMSTMGAGSAEALKKLSDSPLKQRKAY